MWTSAEGRPVGWRGMGVPQWEVNLGIESSRRDAHIGGEPQACAEANHWSRTSSSARTSCRSSVVNILKCGLLNV